MAAFERLQNLGEEKFGKVLNLLMRGEPCRQVARAIQQQPPIGWGDYQNVSEGALMVQLNRLRRAVAEGAFGKKNAQTIIAGHGTQINRLERISVRVLDRMENLANAQEVLVMVLLKKATEDQRSTMATNDAVEGYRKVLLDLQKARFDLGLDEFKGPTSTTTAVRGASQTTTFPDGMSVQKQVFEAVTTIEKILDARHIYVPREE